MKNKVSDFKLISVTLMAILILFTIYFFRYLPLNLFKISSLDYGVNIFYNIMSIILATSLTMIFLINYFKKNDEELKERFKSIGIGLGVFGLYYFLPYLQSIPFNIYGINPNDLPIEVKIIYLISFYILLAALIVLIYNKKVSKDFEDMKKNSIKYFNKYIKYWLIGIGVMMISNLIIKLFIDPNLPNNEQTIRDIFGISPIYIFFSAVIYAPIVEELVFRYSFKKIFSNKWIFIILSGLIFGGMHVFNNFENLTDLLYIIPYSAPGIVFAYMLEKSDNLFVPISFHFIHNGILIALQFFLLIFG